jgi:hypothetical protein
MMVTANSRLRSTIALRCRCNRTLIGERHKSATDKGKQRNNKDPDRQGPAESANATPALLEQ